MNALSLEGMSTLEGVLSASSFCSKKGNLVANGM